MPSSDGQFVDMPPGADPVRQREPDPIVAKLQERMERLPHGHPSSPYNDDGSRKPPLPDLSQYELPIPGDPDYRPEPSRASKADRPETQTSEHVRLGADADERPERTADRTELWEVPPDIEPPTDAEDAEHASEVRGQLDQARAEGLADDTINNHKAPTADRGPDHEPPPDDQEGLDDLDSQKQEERRLSEITDQAVEKCREAEGRDVDGNYGERGLSPAMRRIEAQAEHGNLVPETEKYALKGHDRFKAKLVEMVESEPDKPAEELAREIHDGIRYTFLFDPAGYVLGVRELTRRLEESGFELGVVKNTWGHDEYKGINSRWFDHESGVRFEVQFHTDESWTVKQHTHDAYVNIHNIGTPVEERERLRDYQREISAQVLQPPGWEEILNFRREGW